jgi:hypothetical protein
MLKAALKPGIKQGVKAAPERGGPPGHAHDDPTADSVTGLRWGKTVLVEQRRYAFSEAGRLADLAGFLGEVLTAAEPGSPVPALALEAQGLAVNTTPQGLTIDTSWRLNALEGALPGPFAGVLRLRLAALGRVLGVKPPKRTLATNYNQIRDYAIGLSFDADGEELDGAFNADLIIQFRSASQKSSLKAWPAQAVSSLLDPARVVGVAAEGELSTRLTGALGLAGAGDPADPSKLIDREAFPFAAAFPAGWHTPAAGWLA